MTPLWRHSDVSVTLLFDSAHTISYTSSMKIKPVYAYLSSLDLKQLTDVPSTTYCGRQTIPMDELVCLRRVCLCDPTSNNELWRRSTDSIIAGRLRRRFPSCVSCQRIWDIGRWLFTSRASRRFTSAARNVSRRCLVYPYICWRKIHNAHLTPSGN